MGKNENIGLDAIFGVAEFSSGLKEYMSGLADASSSTEKHSSNIQAGLAAIGGTVVTGAIAAGAAGIGAVTGAAIASIPMMMDYASSVDSIGDVLGTTAEDSSTLDFAIRSVGGNVEGITGQMAFLTKGLTDTKGELGPTGKLLGDMGVAFMDANGQMLPATDIITGVADKLSTMPDGLEKSALMMGLFGKSGKDLTDTMNSLTTEGFANAEQQAKDFGLSMTDETAAGAIELGKKFETLKLAGQGLGVQFGTELMPAVSDITTELIGMAKDALPSIKDALPAIGDFVTGLAKTIIDAIPGIIGAFKDFFTWLSDNKPIVIGVLVALAAAVAVWAYTTIAAAIPAAIAFMTAMWPVIAVIAAVAAVAAALAWAWENNFLGMRDTLTAVWEGTIKPALQTLWDWLSVNIPAAIQAVSDFWTNVMLPAIQAAWLWVQTNVFPIIQTLWDWLATNIPLAIQAVSDFWTNVLLPAITAVWSWIQTNLIPLFIAIGDLLNTVVGVAVTVLAGIWQNVLLPALTAVWGFIQSSLTPILQGLADIWTNTVLPAIQTAADWMKQHLTPILDDIGQAIQDVAGWLNDGLAAAFKAVGDAIQSVIGWIKGLTDHLKNVKLPDWMTPGSPTPWEIGLRGVTAAMKELSRTGIPSIEMGLSGMAAAGYSGSGAMSASSSSPTPSAVNHSTVNNINLGGNNISSGMDMAVFEATVERVLYRILTPGTV